MTALANGRSVQRYGAGGFPNQIHLEQKGTTKIWTGALVVVNAGYADNGAAGVGLVAAGVAYGTYDNLTGADGAQEVVLDQGVFPFANSLSADAITQAHVGLDCYIADNQTVALTNGTGTRSRAGRIIDVDDAGVWVAVGLCYGQGANLAQPIGAALTYTSNDSAPATVANGAIYDVPTTGAASTITLPAAAASGTRIYFQADGTKNGHTVTYRDATGPTSLSTALTASKRHQVTAIKLGTIWTVEAYVAP